MRARAFTLVELLVVVGIIALLLALILVTLRGVQRKGLSAKDLSQLRQLQTAHFTYMTDHRGRFVNVGLPHGNLTNEDVAWINTMVEYFDTEDILQSPLDTSPHWSRDRGGDGIALDEAGAIFRRTSYGCNNYLTQFSPIFPVEGWRHERLSQVDNPAATVHFLIMAFAESGGTEQGFPGADHVHVERWDQGVSPAHEAAIMTEIDAVSRRPDEAQPTGEDQSNYGFLDGHVATLRFSEVYLTPQSGEPPGAPEINRFDPRVSTFFKLRTDPNRSQ